MKKQKIISVKINAFDLIGRKYRVKDNSYNYNTRTHKWEDLYDMVFTIVSLPYEDIATSEGVGKEQIETFILVADEWANFYRVLFCDRGIIL